MFDFDVVPGAAVQQILDEGSEQVLHTVARTYLDHHDGRTVNPDSYFLRFPDRPGARIIALPAHLQGKVALSGIKWISSFPGNVERGEPRASAVLILNNDDTGRPFALLEAAGISAARTAASAALAARSLRPSGYLGTRMAIIGAGIIARTTSDYFQVAGCVPDKYLVHDLDKASGNALVRHLEGKAPARLARDLEEALAADVVIFTTTATVPYVTRPFLPGQLVLNISLRDIAPDVILGACNILDDVDHCLKADTSPHLAEQARGNRDFIDGTLAEVLRGEVTPPQNRPIIFSPFGLGVLDLAVGALVLDAAQRLGTAIRIPSFFASQRRW